MQKLDNLIQKAENLAITKKITDEEWLDLNFQILEIDQSNCGAITRIGVYYFNNGDFDNALKYFNKIDDSFEPQQKNIARNRIAEIQKIQKQIREELYFKQMVEQQNFVNHRDFYSFIITYKNKLDLSQQKELIEKNKKLFDTENKFIFFIKLCDVIGWNEKVQEIISKIIEKQNVKVASQIRHLWSPEKAEIIYRGILEKEPDNIYALNGLIASLGDQEKEEAFALLYDKIDNNLNKNEYRLTIFGLLAKDIDYYDNDFLSHVEKYNKEILIEYYRVLSEYNEKKSLLYMYINHSRES